jgi:hypothetical protein
VVGGLVASTAIVVRVHIGSKLLSMLCSTTFAAAVVERGEDTERIGGIA